MPFWPGVPVITAVMKMSAYMHTVLLWGGKVVAMSDTGTANSTVHETERKWSLHTCRW